MHTAQAGVRRPVVWPLLAVLLMAAATADAQEEGKRVALIVGNDAYSVSPLRNAVNDARAMDKSLREAGFRTVLRENASKSAMETAIVEFLQQLGPDDTALFFYAGHGVQIQQENFLVPVDFQPAASIIDAKYKCISLPQFIENLKGRGSKRTIIVLDACRSFPLAQQQALQAGLAQPLNLGSETYIAFSTSPNSVATDNPNGSNSFFTEALADLIQQPEMAVDEVFNRVRNRVMSATVRKQTPWSQSSLSGTFYFHPPAGGNKAGDATLAEKWMSDALLREQRGDFAEAIAKLNQVAQRGSGDGLEQAAKARLPYLAARRDAQARYEAGDFAGAAGLFEKALTEDVFAIDAAILAANAYLLNDQLPQAVKLLGAVRQRGTTESITKADAMLKALAPVSPEAGQELKSAAPPPPPIEQIFSGRRFGVPDFDAVRRHQQANPVEMARWFQDITPAAPPALTVAPDAPPSPPQAADASPQQAAIAAEVFHVEVAPAAGSRDIRIRPVSPGSEYGVLQLDGAPGFVPVLVDGRQVAQQIPYSVQLPPGKYLVRAMKDGQVVGSSEVEIKVLGSVKMTVNR